MLKALDYYVLVSIIKSKGLQRKPSIGSGKFTKLLKQSKTIRFDTKEANICVSGKFVNEGCIIFKPREIWRENTTIDIGMDKLQGVRSSMSRKIGEHCTWLFAM